MSKSLHYSEKKKDNNKKNRNNFKTWKIVLKPVFLVVNLTVYNC